MISSYAPSGHIFTCRHITCTCLYKRTELQLSSSISFGDMRGSENKKWELLISPDHCPVADKFLYWLLVRVNA